MEALPDPHMPKGNHIKGALPIVLRPQHSR